MAFKLRCSLANTTPSTEYFEGKEGEKFTSGEALTLSDGTLTKCAPTDKPTFICLGNADEGNVPVMRVFDFYLFDCPVSGDASALSQGDIVTLDSEGTGVTSTTGDVAEIVEINGNTVTVKF